MTNYEDLVRRLDTLLEEVSMWSEWPDYDLPAIGEAAGAIKAMVERAEKAEAERDLWKQRYEAVEANCEAWIKRAEKGEADLAAVRAATDRVEAILRSMDGWNWQDKLRDAIAAAPC